MMSVTNSGSNSPDGLGHTVTASGMGQMFKNTNEGMSFVWAVLKNSGRASCRLDGNGVTLKDLLELLTAGGLMGDARL